MTTEEKLKHCIGCRDNYYNQSGNSSTGYCWMLDTMKLVMRKEVHVSQRPPWNQKEKLLPDCYHKPQYVYVDPKQIS